MIKLVPTAKQNLKSISSILAHLYQLHMHCFLSGCPSLGQNY